MKKISLYILLAGVMLVTSCAPSRFVKPLEKGQKSVDFHLGGEMINFSGMVIPIPFTSVTAGYGVKEDLTAFGSLYLTDLAYENVHVDIGAVKEVYQSKDSALGVSVTPQINVVYGLSAGQAKIWPQLDANAYWQYGLKNGKNNFAYLGISNWFELSGTKAHEEPQDYFWIPNAHIGHQFTKPKTDYFTEIKYVAPFRTNQNVAVDYWKPFGLKNGAIGIYVGIRKKF